MKSLVFRIRKQYFDAIVSGEKITEFRPDKQFWRSRIDGKGDTEQWVAVFICGRKVHRRLITLIQKIDTPEWFSEQGKRDVSTPKCYAVHLGKEVSGEPNEKKGVSVEFGTFEEFWKYCHGGCPNDKEGCASTCELRRKLKISPFGTFKWQGEIPK